MTRRNSWLSLIRWGAVLRLLVVLALVVYFFIRLLSLEARVETLSILPTVAYATETTPSIEPTVSVVETPSVEPTLTARQVFVAKWAPRINRYLRRTPMHGLGTVMAQEAWQHHLDPRLQAVIAMKESGGGRAGSLARVRHNPFGWYGRRFPNYTAAVRAHAAYLVRMYWGGKLTPRMAHRYCPPSAHHWYSWCRAQMRRI